MQGEAASIELPVRSSMDITKSNQRTRRRVTCYNLTDVFGTVVPAVIKSIAKENLRPVSREDTIDARYERTLAMTWRLRQRGYRVIEKWKCEFSREKR